MPDPDRQSDHLARGDKLPWWTWVAPLPIVHMAAWLSIITNAGNGIALLYAPVALGMVMIYWWGPRVLWGLYLGVAVSVPLWSLPIEFGPLFAISSTLQVALSWWLFARVLRGCYWLPTLADLIRFLTIGLAVPTATTGFFLAALITFLVPDDTRGFWVNYANGVFGDAAAHLALTVPALVLLSPLLSRARLTAHDSFQGARTPIFTRGWRDGVTLAGIFAAVAGSITAADLVAGMPFQQSWIISGLLMVVLALRFGFRVVVLGTSWTILLALASYLMAVNGHIETPPDYHVLVTHSSIAVFCAMSLLMGRAISDLRGEVLSREQSQQALRESEQRYRQLFENMTAGFMHCQMIWDPDRQPIDYRVLQVNPAFEALTGLSRAQVTGRTIREVLPNVEDDWIEIAGRVAQNRQPQAFENYSNDLGRYYSTWLFSPAPNEFASVFMDVTQRRKAEQSRDLLIAEMDHRVRNNLTAILSLAGPTAEGSQDLPSFMATFNNRLSALAASHDLLSRSHWTGLDLADAIDRTVRPFVDADDRLCTIGEPIELKARMAMALCLSLNELATNAVKHGVLSSGNKGWINIEWRKTNDDQLAIFWSEHGLTPCEIPPTLGQGLQLIRDMIEQDVGGSVEFTFAETGFVCRMTLPLASSSEPTATAS